MDSKNCAIVLGPCILRDSIGAPALETEEDEALLVQKINAGNRVVEYLLECDDLDQFF